MKLTLRDGRDGAWREVSPAAAPVLSYRAGPGPRERVTAALLARAAAYLGWEPRETDGAADLAVGGAAPEGGEPWLKVGPETGGARPSPDLDFLRARTHYAAPLAATAAAVAAAGEERRRLEAALASLGAAPGAASPRALAGYGHRVRDALSHDLDAPAALAALRDALRPGALSPGSRAALLREVLPLLIP